MELCKTRIKKSSLDMLKFYVVLASHDMVTDTGRATMCRRKFKAPLLQRKIHRMKVLPKTWVSPNNRLNVSYQKLKTFSFGIGERNKGTTKPQKQQLKMDLVTRRKYTKIILREAFRLKLKTSPRLQLVKS